MNKANELTKYLLFPNIPANAKESIESQYAKLEEINITFEEPIDLIGTLSELAIAIETGNINEEKIADLHADGVIGQNRLDRQQAQFYMSCIAYLHAKNKIDSGDEMAAWPLLSHTSYLIGQTETVHAAANEIRWKLDNALPGRKLGGKTTSEKYDPLRLRMIELLQIRAPKGGWKTKKQAVETIYLDLERFVSENPSLDIKIDDIHQTATNWLKKSGNAEINHAYQMHSSEAYLKKTSN